MSKKDSQLPKSAIRKLGKVSDKSLSEEFGVGTHLIRAERATRGIPKWQHIDWTAERIAILGTMPDSHAAKLIGVTKSAVFSKRVSLGIQPFGKSKAARRYHWKPADLRQLGKVSDAVLAKALGVSGSVVTAKRHSLGVASSGGKGKPRRPWTTSELATLGKKADTVVAAETGRGRRHVRAKREELGIPASVQQKSLKWTNAIIARMGILTNKMLAEELGVSEGTVAIHRRRLLGKSR